MSTRATINEIVSNPNTLNNEAEWPITRLKIAMEEIPNEQCVEKFVCIGKKPAQIRVSLFDFCKKRNGKLFVENNEDAVVTQEEKAAVAQSQQSFQAALEKAKALKAAGNNRGPSPTVESQPQNHSHSNSFSQSQPVVMQQMAQNIPAQSYQSTDPTFGINSPTQAMEQPYEMSTVKNFAATESFTNTYRPQSASKPRYRSELSGGAAFEKYSELKHQRDSLVIRVHEMKLEIKKIEAEMDNIKLSF